MSALRLLRWVLVNGAFGVLAWAACVEQSVPAGRAVVFFGWLLTAFTLLNCSDLEGCARRVATQRHASGRSPTPEWFMQIDALFDLALILFFAAHGWTWTAVLYAVNWVLITGITEQVESVHRELQSAGGQRE